MTIEEFLNEIKQKGISLGEQKKALHVRYSVRSYYSLVSYIDLDVPRNSLLLKVDDTYHRVSLNKITEINKKE